MLEGKKDVVKKGDEKEWKKKKFEEEIEEGVMYGSGEVEMKGGIECLVEEVERKIEKNGKIKGRI